MPGTHLLPPNLLKLFAPRPPLPYTRPVDRDIDRIRKKEVSGVAAILKQLKDANTETLINAGTSDAMEEGEEPVYTHAEETKRQMRREERKAKKAEEFKIAKETCMFAHFSFLLHISLTLLQTNLLMIQRPSVTLTRHSSSHVWLVDFFCCLSNCSNLVYAAQISNRNRFETGIRNVRYDRTGKNRS